MTLARSPIYGIGDFVTLNYYRFDLLALKELTGIAVPVIEDWTGVIEARYFLDDTDVEITEDILHLYAGEELDVSGWCYSIKELYPDHGQNYEIVEEALGPVMKNDLRYHDDFYKLRRQAERQALNLKKLGIAQPFYPFMWDGNILETIHALFIDTPIASTDYHAHAQPIPCWTSSKKLAESAAL